MMGRTNLALCLPFQFLVLYAGLGSPCFAEDGDDENLFSFQIENDTFVKGNSTDEWYTNGVRINWSPVADKFGLPFDGAIINLLGSGLCVGTHTGIRPTTYFIGQNMYTPNKIADPNPQPNDRPWAGWLYLGKKYQVIGKASATPVLRSLEGSIGVLGPKSYAEQTQKMVHDIFHATTPQGWDNQISGRMTLSLNYLEKMKFGSEIADAIFEYGGNVGNVMNYANSGLTFRVGHNLCDFGVSTIPVTVQSQLHYNSTDNQPAANPSKGDTGCDEKEMQRKLSFYGFAGLGIKAVASNVFIDGRTKNGVSSISMRPFVYDLNAGLTIRKNAWAFSYIFVRRSKEFDGGVEHPHKFGSIAVSW